MMPEQHYSHIKRLSRYAQISPVISYLSYEMNQLEYVSYENLKNGRIVDFKNLLSAFKEVIDSIHERGANSVGIEAHCSLKKGELRRKLNSLEFVTQKDGS